MFGEAFSGDALNVVVPFGEHAYYQLRPSIAIPAPGGAARAALDLDGFFGLHPSLAPLKPLWDRHMLAPIHAVGSPSNTRSHFDAQDYMESGTPDLKGTSDGWLNRYLATSGTCEQCGFTQADFKKTGRFGCPACYDAFRGLLEPGVRVPFGAGWVEVPVMFDKPVSRVRVRIDQFWAGGGGLNEVQIYPR